MHVHPGLGYSIRWLPCLVSSAMLNLMFITFDETKISHNE